MPPPRGLPPFCLRNACRTWSFLSLGAAATAVPNSLQRSGGLRTASGVPLIIVTLAQMLLLCPSQDGAVRAPGLLIQDAISIGVPDVPSIALPPQPLLCANVFGAYTTSSALLRDALHILERVASAESSAMRAPCSAEYATAACLPLMSAIASEGVASTGTKIRRSDHFATVSSGGGLDLLQPVVDPPRFCAGLHSTRPAPDAAHDCAAGRLPFVALCAAKSVLVVHARVLGIETSTAARCRCCLNAHEAVRIGQRITVSARSTRAAPNSPEHRRAGPAPAVPVRALPFVARQHPRINVRETLTAMLAGSPLQPVEPISVFVHFRHAGIRALRAAAAFKNLGSPRLPDMSRAALEAMTARRTGDRQIQTDEAALAQRVGKPLRQFIAHALKTARRAARDDLRLTVELVAVGALKPI